MKVSLLRDPAWQGTPVDAILYVPLMPLALYLDGWRVIWLDAEARPDKQDFLLRMAK